MDYPLIPFLDSLLGPGEMGSGSNRKYSCPFPECENRASKLRGDRKLEIDLHTDEKNQNHFHCWSCNTKGKSIRTLLKALKSPQSRYDELSSIIKYSVRNSQNANQDVQFDGELPVEYKFLGKISKGDIIGRHAKVYLKERGYNEDDIFKYSIGYCDEGRYSNRIIIPSYDANAKVNYFIARSFDKDCDHRWRYLNPKASREVIPFEMYINWEEPIIICEGGMDMIAIKRNAIPLMDKIISESLLKKILSSGVKKIYMAIDNDSLKLALKHCEDLMKYGKKLYLVNMDKKDPSEMGFEEFTKLIQTSQPLSVSRFMKLKMQLI